MSRHLFAFKIGVNPRTLERWEQGRSKPNEQAAALIWLVRKYPDTLKRSESLAASNCRGRFGGRAAARISGSLNSVRADRGRLRRPWSFGQSRSIPGDDLDGARLAAEFSWARLRPTAIEPVTDSATFLLLEQTGATLGVRSNIRVVERRKNKTEGRSVGHSDQRRYTERRHFFQAMPTLRGNGEEVCSTAFRPEGFGGARHTGVPIA